ncbi:antiviral RADAR system adenosine triphosphatase RdrA [Pseudomonas asiatica]|uniref:antiviral RADAR system adenosine triphosphatase RdrA n=1 Tax=Pseudomonas asiatica TaxID=2219225 RepID=UPI0034588C05
MSTPTQIARYIPLNAPETANLDDETLLPLAVYQGLAGFITKALHTASDQRDSARVNEVRSHNAVSIDGERGTGKTSVLVNLRKYLKSAHESVLKDIHILDPVDPTLLEEHESLFLHIIVAAVISDDDVKRSQSVNPEGYKQLNQTLDKLAHALECIDVQKEERGMDKLRALFGNKHLADRVQDFFRAVLNLLGKKLLVLPIDDVDTSLNRAFENLEIVRRYLTTPYVLPIVSGDRGLYREVTWRDFHGRLTEDSSHNIEQAYSIAIELANEYQRKVLPLPRRLVMPPVSKYLNDREISLGSPAIISLPNFHAWLNIFLTGPVNGREGSDLTLPIPSVRALTQLVNSCSDLIQVLPQAIRSAENPLQVMRVWQMPTVHPDVIKEFHAEHQRLNREKKREFGPAYRIFAEQPREQAGLLLGALDQTATVSWERTLSDYFQYEPQAGAVYLVLQAYQYWQWLANSGEEERRGSIFDTPLFQPLQHDATGLEQFVKLIDFSEWKAHLSDKLPYSWLSRLDSHKALLSYPVPEVGINSAKDWKYWEVISGVQADSEVKSKARFLLSLLTQHNYYTNAKRSMMLNIGRVFELLITSLVGPVSLQILQNIVQDAPFHSTSALAPTKTLSLGFDEDDEPIESGLDDVLEGLNPQLEQLQKEIAEWRARHQLDQVRFSPWLVYKVFNKVFSQIAGFKNVPNGMKDISTALDKVGMVFYATWSAFGSFEKGRLFGLPDVVATVNLNSPHNFEQNDHFKVNVLPFAPTKGQRGQDTPDSIAKREYGASTRTASYFLADHPVRLWLDEILEISWPKEFKKISAKEWLCGQLGVEPPERLTQKFLDKVLRESTEEERRKVIAEMAQQYPNANELRSLEKVHQDMQDNQG